MDARILRHSVQRRRQRRRKDHLFGPAALLPLDVDDLAAVQQFTRRQRSASGAISPVNG